MIQCDVPVKHSLMSTYVPREKYSTTGLRKISQSTTRGSSLFASTPMLVSRKAVAITSEVLNVSSEGRLEIQPEQLGPQFCASRLTNI